MDYLIIVAAVLISLAIGVTIGTILRKKIAESKIEGAEKEAKRLVDLAKIEAENMKKEEIFKAKEEIIKDRSELEKEIKERRGEIQKQETRLIQKEENIEKRADIFEKKEKELENEYEALEGRKKDIENMYDEQVKELERIAGLNKEEAKKYLLDELEKQITTEKAALIREQDKKAKEQADKNAKEILGYAIQKCAADHTSEATVSIVSLPNDDMKGRIIGREGRNIKALETLTGIDLIIDDTPEAVIISGFDPLRREIAKRAILEAGVNGLNQDLVDLLGKLKYRTSYGQNVLNHSIEVANLARIMADEIGVDAKLARRAGLLHDIGKALDHDMEGTHVEIGVDILRKYKENELVINAVEAHHGDVEPQTLEAILVQAADAISASRPGARKETLEAYIKRLQNLETIADSFEGVDKSFAIQAGREIRVKVKPEKIKDDEMIILARDIAKQVEDEMDYPGQIKVNIVRETRAIEYAK